MSRIALFAAILTLSAGQLFAQPFEVIIVKNTGAATAEDDYVSFIEGIYGAGNVNVTVDAFSGLTTAPDNLAALEAADLVIVSRATNSGDYDDGTEVSDWNGISTPLLLHSPYLSRSTRWNWFPGSQDENEPTETLDVDFASDPIFDGVTLIGGQVDMLGPGGVSDIMTDLGAGNGTLVASETDANGSQVVIARWAAGTEFYAGSGEFAGGERIFWGMNSPPYFFDNATADGQLMLSNAIQSLLPQAVVPEPSSIAVWTLIGLAVGGFGWYRSRKKK